MKIRGFDHGVWTGAVPTTDREQGPYRIVNGSAHVRCGSCGEWTPVWGVQTGVAGHWSVIDNPRFGKVNPKTHQLDDRETIRVVKSRRVELCADCAWAWTQRRAATPTMDQAWIPDRIQRERDV